MSGTVSFTVSGFCVEKIGAYSAISGGTQYGIDSTASGNFTGLGTYTVDTASFTISDP